MFRHNGGQTEGAGGRGGGGFNGQWDERVLTAPLLSPSASRRRCSTQALGKKRKSREEEGIGGKGGKKGCGGGGVGGGWALSGGPRRS